MLVYMYNNMYIYVMYMHVPYTCTCTHTHVYTFMLNLLALHRFSYCQVKKYLVMYHGHTRTGAKVRIIARNYAKLRRDYA